MLGIICVNLSVLLFYCLFFMLTFLLAGCCLDMFLGSQWLELCICWITGLTLLSILSILEGVTCITSALISFFLFLQNGSLLVFDLRRTAGPVATMKGLTNNPIHTVHSLPNNSALPSGARTVLSASSIGLCLWNVDNAEEGWVQICVLFFLAQLWNHMDLKIFLITPSDFINIFFKERKKKNSICTVSDAI